MGLAKITRICASDCAFPTGEIEAIQGGSDGLGRAATEGKREAPVVDGPQDAAAIATTSAPSNNRTALEHYPQVW
jgi:hypothetical protein